MLIAQSDASDTMVGKLAASVQACLCLLGRFSLLVFEAMMVHGHPYHVRPRLKKRLVVNLAYQCSCVLCRVRGGGGWGAPIHLQVVHSTEPQLPCSA